MSTPDFIPGYEIQDNDGQWYRVIEDLTDYWVKVYSFDRGQEEVIEKRYFTR